MTKCPISKNFWTLGFGIWDLIRAIRNSSLVIFIFFCFLISFSFPTFAADSLFYTITVSASIGEPKLTLFGYASPFAKVELRGYRVSEETKASEIGYFFFDRIFLPRPRPGYPELCLLSIDTQSRTSFPTCLPPLPVGPFNITVGPVLLSPTISLEKGKFLPGEQVAAKGATLPNSEVTIFLAYETKTPRRWPKGLLRGEIVKKAYASPLPKYQIRADKNGSFEFNLPANWPTTWRVFAAAKHLGSPTPKSNTITFRILFWWQWLWEKLKQLFWALLGFLRPYLWLYIILAEMVVIILFVKRKKQRRKSLLERWADGSDTKGVNRTTP